MRISDGDWFLVNQCFLWSQEYNVNINFSVIDEMQGNYFKIFFDRLSPTELFSFSHHCSSSYTKQAHKPKGNLIIDFHCAYTKVYVGNTYTFRYFYGDLWMEPSNIKNSIL